jgi:cytochrome c oxidase subunit 3
VSEASATLHPPFASAIRQREAVVFGMWLFLASELLLFGGLFFAYFVYRYQHPGAFAQAGAQANLGYGATNTALLITSSFTLSVGSRAIGAGRVRLAEIGVWITFVLGALFLAVKGLEYRDDLAKHLWPGAGFALQAPATRIFWALYWIVTGLHACHITIGLGLLGRLGWMARAGRLTANSDSVEATTLYWHLVDVIWTLVFPCLYLVGR